MNPPPHALLSWQELRLAAQAGIDRQVHNLAAGRGDTYAAAQAEAGWQYAITGTLGEWVVAKVLGLYPSGLDLAHAYNGDVGAVEVRSTPRPDGCLILHPQDRNAAYVLVAGMTPAPGGVRFHLPGWIMGATGKNDAWWRTTGVRHPAYFIPQHALEPVATLAAHATRGAT